MNSASDPPFDSIPVVTLRPAAGDGRLRAAIVVLLALVGVGTAVGYAVRPSREVPADTPRVVVDVIGMHCPLQCGPRAAGAVESLPWAIPGSVTANIRTGVVTFAVTDPAAADEGEVRRVIEGVGYRVRSVHLPARPAE
ncbi:hypothetical protein [Urbifossiella limnaea]|uniref:HMA domain-containing protein n=1 Tax=Urbifossiella limnaea TaxID=2528023 RepID=A0A517XQ04_9BACT|nr:hypothetical protein [Urbifossiella limnaea]QDU19590.1 hypothetical protein ETAA1_15200 [Urbifossiella limnaea]